jgi:hypothetical protein
MIDAEDLHIAEDSVLLEELAAAVTAESAGEQDHLPNPNEIPHRAEPNLADGIDR